MSTAFATRDEIGCGTEPKLENASMADLRRRCRSSREVRRQQRDLREFLGRRLDVHHRVGAEEDPVLQHEHVRGRDARHARLQPDDLDGRPDGLRERLVHPADEPVGVALLHHHQAVDGGIAHHVERRRQGHALALPQLVQRLRVRLLRARRSARSRSRSRAVRCPAACARDRISASRPSSTGIAIF